MPWDEKKMYVCEHTDKQECPKKSDTSKRNLTFRYSLMHNGVSMRVCKNMFLSTLGIGEKSVYQWVKKVDGRTGIPIRGENEKKKKHPSANELTAREYLESLPKVPSHYCRSESKKEYIEPVFGSMVELHSVYKEYCAEHDKRSVSKTKFYEVFNDMNLSLFKTRKDQCDTCVSFEAGNITEDIYSAHIKRKDKARESKAKDKLHAEDNPTVKVITVDMQAVLLAPMLKANALYYKTKLACHNYTVYDVVTKDVSCYFWTESDGDLSANSFASCVTDYINNLPTSVEKVIVYSDGCNYQYRNVVLANALLKLSKDRNILIVQKLLEKGHTQMEVDSVHATIEHTIKDQPMYSPACYVSKIIAARLTKSYEVKYLSYDFFKDFSKLNYYTGIRPGTKAGDPTVYDIRCLHYLKGEGIQVQLNFDEVEQDLPRRAKRDSPKPEDTVGRLHTGRLPIKGSKYKHLQELKSVIPRDYHGYYDSLKYA